MPKNKKGKRDSAKPAAVKNGFKGETDTSDDEVASEVLSHHSSASEGASAMEESAGAREVDERTEQEDMEDKLKQCIDNLMDKSTKTRLAALESLRRAFSSKQLYDFLAERRITVSDCLERSLKKGGAEEQAAAATLFVLLCVQLGGGDEADECFKMLLPILTYILMDNSASMAARQSCARALGLCSYICAADDGEDLIKVLALLESVFMHSYPNGEGTLPTSRPGGPGLHGAALQAWSLLVTLCPTSKLTKLLDQHLPKLQACLESSDVNYRIAVGETIALLVELGRDMDEQFEVEDSEGLCQCLKSLATDGNKHRAKTDRRKQRSIFREVLHYIERDEFTEETIKFGGTGIRTEQRFHIDNWMKRRSYDAFRQLMESGVREHLKFNHLLRDILGLGPPPSSFALACLPIVHHEKHHYNSAAFKARTKQRSKFRDKRADVM
ncbi:interferon-related developmental regulator 2 isoform X2 [Nelusetta ayraudi]|uniref:interferon-related developmental regulator 2 isoform X2 n=1 Tax=Nelusetta ayraudi TaxID=303726 RepID=UPI003F6F7A23